MRAYIEVWAAGGGELFPLEHERTTLGRSESSDVCVADPTVSALHAVIESYGPIFAVRDVGSSNGTFVNGERVTNERRLRPGDELRLGDARLVLRTQGGDEVRTTLRSEGPPDLTRREHEVLVALCRPMLGSDAFTQPAGVRQLADDLVVSQSAVKFHLANLYDKFGLFGTGESRRVQLANEAIRRRAVTVEDLRGGDGSRQGEAG